MALGIRPPAFVGAYPDYATAKAHAPRDTPNSYDDDQVAPLNFELMSQLHIWDYPVVFWLGKLMQPGLHVVDAGGHFGTKYIAFRDLLPLAEIRWSVQDLPAVIRASRAAQQRGAVPAEVNFIDALLDGGGRCPAGFGFAAISRPSIGRDGGRAAQPAPPHPAE